MEQFDFTDRTAIVTGASAGIGRATAELFAEAGANVAIAARRTDRLEADAEAWTAAHPGRVIPIPTDLRNESDCESMVEETVDAFGGIDILVNNAGVSRGGSVATLDTESYRTMQETNVDGTFFVTRAAIPALTRSAGNLIFVGSFAGKYPRPFNPVYAATKWWVRGFALSVMAQIGDDDVAVSIVNPSEVRSEFGSHAGEPFYDRFEPGEAVEPAEVAVAIATAAAQDAVTFSEIDVNRRDKLVGF